MRGPRTYQYQSRFRDGINCLWRCQKLYREDRDRGNEARVLADLGDFYTYVSEFDQARRMFRLSLERYEDRGHSVAESVRAKLDDLAAPPRR